MFGGGPEAAEVQVGIERAEQDVQHVERAQGSLLEDGRELVAVPGAPARRVEAEEQGDHGRSPAQPGDAAEPLEAELRELGELAELVGEDGAADGR